MDSKDIELQESLFSQFARLVVAQGSSPHTEYFFLHRLTLGRGTENAVRLVDGSVSTRHAVIEAAGGGRYRIRDLGSRNGVLVNGNRVTECDLNPNDRIQLGAALLVFLRYGASGSSPSVPAKGAHLEAPEDHDRTHHYRPPATADGDPGAALAEVIDALEALPGDADAASLGRALLEQVMKHWPADRGVVLSLEGGQLVVRAVRVAPAADTGSDVVVPRLIADEVLARRTPLTASRGGEDPRFQANDEVLDDGVQSLVAVPLAAGTLARGVLYLESWSSEALNAGAVSALVAIGQVAGLALRRMAGARAHAERGPALPAGLAPGPDGKPRRMEAVVMRVAVNTASASQVEPEAFLLLIDRFFCRVAEVILRNGGAIEWIVGPTLKASFPSSDSSGERVDGAVRAALEVHRDCFASNLRARLARGVELASRVSLEAGPVTIGLAGIGSQRGLVSMGSAANDAAALLQTAERGEVVAGPGVVERWGPVLALGRQVGVPGHAAGIPAGRSILGLASEPGPVRCCARAAGDVIPVAIQPLAGGVGATGVLLVDPAVPERLSLELPRTEATAAFAAGDLLAIALDRQSEGAAASFHVRVERVDAGGEALALELSLVEPEVHDTDDLPTDPAGG